MRVECHRGHDCAMLLNTAHIASFLLSNPAIVPIATGIFSNSKAVVTKGSS